MLRGFENAANGKKNAAEQAFVKAIELAPNYPEAWLGKGLIEFNKGNKKQAQQDLIAAAALQPNNSILRSYLAKGFAENHEAPIPFIGDNSNGLMKQGPSMNWSLQNNSTQLTQRRGFTPRS